MTEQFANNFKSSLLLGINDSDDPVEITLDMDSADFPVDLSTGDWRLKIGSEILLVTAIVLTGDNPVLTADRAQEGTEIAAHGIGTKAIHILTAESLAGIVDDSFHDHFPLIDPDTHEIDASYISYDNTDSGLTAEQVQAAIDEVSQETAKVGETNTFTGPQYFNTDNDSGLGLVVQKSNKGFVGDIIKIDAAAAGIAFNVNSEGLTYATEVYVSDVLQLNDTDVSLDGHAHNPIAISLTHSANALPQPLRVQEPGEELADVIIVTPIANGNHTNRITYVLVYQDPMPDPATYAIDGKRIYLYNDGGVTEDRPIYLARDPQTGENPWGLPADVTSFEIPPKNGITVTLDLTASQNGVNWLQPYAFLFFRIHETYKFTTTAESKFSYPSNPTTIDAALRDTYYGMMYLDEWPAAWAYFPDASHVVVGDTIRMSPGYPSLDGPYFDGEVISKSYYASTGWAVEVADTSISEPVDWDTYKTGDYELGQLAVSHNHDLAYDAIGTAYDLIEDHEAHDIITFTGFYDTLIANQSNQQMDRAGIRSSIGVVMTHAGSIMGLSCVSTKVRSAGSVTFTVRKNNNPTSMTTTLNSDSMSYNTGIFNDPGYAFAAGDILDIHWTSTADWAHAGGGQCEVEAILEVVYEPAH